MGLTAALIGGASGTSIHLMTNAMRKVPLSRSKFEAQVERQLQSFLFRSVSCSLLLNTKQRVTMKILSWFGRN